MSGSHLGKSYHRLNHSMRIQCIYRLLYRARVLKKKEHHISRKQISSPAIQVIERLVRHGYQAFLVGGCVRDLLLKKTPKDFDVTTNADPEIVHRLFAHARIVGKRFRIVHIPFKHELIEVTTFRGHQEQIKTMHHGSRLNHADNMVKSASGMHLRDNVYGSIKEDAARRDFTVNACYYDLFTEQLFTFGSGFADLHKGVLKMIGDPQLRYCEDPVRMLRALRLSVKLGFTIDQKTLDPIHHLHGLLSEVSPGRLYEEFKKMFLQGDALTLCKQLLKYKLMQHFFPVIRYFYQPPLAESKAITLNYRNFVLAALRNTDRRIQEKKPVTPTLLCAVLLWPEVVKRTTIQQPWYTMHPAELSKISTSVFAEQKRFMFIPRPLVNRIRSIWLLQLRLRNSENPEKITAHQDFRIAYNFLIFYEQAIKGDHQAPGKWWTEYLEHPGQKSPNKVIL